MKWVQKKVQFFALLIMLTCVSILLGMEEPPKKTRGKSQHHKELKSYIEPLSSSEREQHETAVKKAYEQRKKISFLVSGESLQAQLQEAQNYIFNPSSTLGDYAKAEHIIEKLINQNNKKAKAEALFLRGVMRFNGLGQPINYKEAFNDFNHILKLTGNLEIKQHATDFKRVTQAMIAITEAVHNSESYEHAFQAVKKIVHEIPQHLFNETFYERILMIMNNKYPALNRIATVYNFDIPGALATLQNLITTKPEYYNDALFIVEQALAQKSRELFIELFKIPALAQFIMETHDVLIKAVKARDYETLELFHSAGANINYTNAENLNPLMIGIIQGDVELVQWLLAKKAEPFYPIVKGNDITTPFAIANSEQYPHKQEILKLLQPFIQTSTVQPEIITEEEPKITETPNIPTTLEEAFAVAKKPIMSLPRKRRAGPDILKPRAHVTPKEKE